PAGKIVAQSCGMCDMKMGKTEEPAKEPASPDRSDGLAPRIHPGASIAVPVFGNRRGRRWIGGCREGFGECQGDEIHPPGAGREREDQEEGGNEGTAEHETTPLGR